MIFFNTVAQKTIFLEGEVISAASLITYTLKRFLLPSLPIYTFDLAPVFIFIRWEPRKFPCLTFQRRGIS